MSDVKTQVADFFERYPDADCCHEALGQLFHDNAKDAAHARAKYYGGEVVKHDNPGLAKVVNMSGDDNATTDNATTTDDTAKKVNVVANDVANVAKTVKAPKAPKKRKEPKA